MTTTQLIFRSLRFFWRTHLGVFAGVIVTAAVLVGALTVGDSVRSSLRQQTEDRIGGVSAVMAAGDRFFEASLADRIESAIGESRLAPVLQLTGVVSSSDGGARAGIVDVLGVDKRFFALAPQPGTQGPANGEVFINQRLAHQLDAAVGDEILVRVEKPSFIPRDMAMATIDDISFAMRVKVVRLLDESEFGRFSLRAGQVPPFNVFLSLDWLQQQLELSGRANLMLAGGVDGAFTQSANDALLEHWQLSDIGLATKDIPGSESFELLTNRVFLDLAIVDAARAIEPGLLGVLTYFLNSIEAGENKTPYSTVAAIGTLDPTAPAHDPTVQRVLDLLPKGMPNDGIVLNEWANDDLRANAREDLTGKPVQLAYFVMGPDLSLEDRSRSFRVMGSVPLSGAAADPTLMPEFPGLADSENCRDWEPGFAVDLDKIRDQDELYWDDHKGTPKGFIRLAAGQELWQNRYGSLTSIRAAKTYEAELRRKLRQALDPAVFGLFFTDFRGLALASSASATDFGGLFLGLSFFLIIAALLLTTLLFVFGVEQRAAEIGTLLAIGFRPKQVRKLFMTEALLLTITGSLIGALLGMLYTQGVLYGLSSLWQGAIGSTSIHFHASPITLAIGVFSSVLCALLSLRWALRKTFERPAVELMASRLGVMAPKVDKRPLKYTIAILWIAGGGLIIIAAITVYAMPAAAFFGAGAMLLLGGIHACRTKLHSLAQSGPTIDSVARLAIRNTGRRPGRSLATIALLASGTFLVVSIQANRLEAPDDYSVRTSGTGGFAFYGRSSLPVLRDPSSAEGLDAFGLDPDSLQGAEIVPLRVRDGDDASCLNLNLPQSPRLVGVDPQALADRGAFSLSLESWLDLNADHGKDVVPAIGDAASVMWAMHKSVGDTITYTDEAGKPFAVKIIGTISNSIMQGNLIIAGHHLQERFPSASGFRMFLIDAKPDKADQIASSLTKGLQDIGLELTTTRERLQTLNAVQNTYLLIFQALGGLGLILGSLGLGVVLLRNTLERRGELALMSAIGYSLRDLRKLIWVEHCILLGLGLLVAILAGLAAVIPGLIDTEGPSILPMFLLVAGLGLTGAIGVSLAVRLATRGDLLNALRDE